MKQVFFYFSIAYLISWTIWLPLYSHVFGWDGLPIISFQHAIGGLGPFLSAFITTYFFEKAEGIRKLWKAMWQIRPVLYLSIALFSPFLLAFLACLIDFFLENKTPDASNIFSSREFPQFNFITFFIYNLLFFGFGEEVGWRGFVLPRFQKRFSALFSAFLLTIFWAVWHWPLFFYRPGFVSMGLSEIVGWLFSLLTGSVLLSWFYNSSKGSLLVCAVFHSTIDIVFLTDFKGQNITDYMGILITIWGILIIILFSPKRLSVKNNVQLKC